MPICCVTWIASTNPSVIASVVKAERITFTTVAASSGVCPPGANAAIVRCLEGDAMVSNDESALVTDATGHRVAGNEVWTFSANPGVTKISAKDTTG